MIRIQLVFSFPCKDTEQEQIQEAAGEGQAYCNIQHTCIII